MTQAVVVRPNLWRWNLALLFLAGLGVFICSLLLVKLNDATEATDLQVAENSALIEENSALITQLQVRDDALAAQAAEARQRESALLLLVRGLQAQVAALGGTPLQLPPELRSEPASRGPSTPVTAEPSSRPAEPAPAAPSPAPTQSRQPQESRPSPSASPRPTSTPTPGCLVTVGQVCIPRPA